MWGPNMGLMISGNPSHHMNPNIMGIRYKHNGDVLGEIYGNINSKQAVGVSENRAFLMSTWSHFCKTDDKNHQPSGFLYPILSYLTMCHGCFIRYQAIEQF